MQLTPPVPAAEDADLAARVFARLDRRLSRDVSHPLALALSGGGDSVALLHLTAAWAQARGRRLVALTVDHQLQPESEEWSRFARAAAQAVGVEWVGLHWPGRKPTTGVTAAARAVRHRLVVETARAAGARVALFAHTADDIDEADWMRARGSTLGRLREWSPSPVWPEGRDLMLARPLLTERREALRRWLSHRGARWIEDPANVDLRYGRSRARLALRASSSVRATPCASPRSSSASSLCWLDDGLLSVQRTVGATALAFALVCLGGGSTPPRRSRLEAQLARLRAGEDFVAVLAGTRLQASGNEVVLMREAGEWLRRPIPPLALAPGRPAVWDGRYLFTAKAEGWSVAPARGRLSRLCSADRAWLGGLPPAARGAVPVLLRDGDPAPVLASEAVERRDLTRERLRLALDETTHEDDLIPAPDGATPLNALFSGADNPDRRSSPDRRRTEDLNEPA